MATVVNGYCGRQYISRNFFLTVVCKAGICNMVSIELLRKDPYMEFLL